MYYFSSDWNLDQRRLSIDGLSGLLSFTHLIQIQSGFNPRPEVDYLIRTGIRILEHLYVPGLA